MKPRLTLKHVKEFCENRNIIFLDTQYKNSHFGHTYKCIKCSNIWKGKFTNIQQGKGCANCYGNKKHSLQQIKEFCLNKQIQFLDEDYQNVNFKHNFQCIVCQNIWRVKFGHIQQGSGCPICSKFKNEKLTKSILNSFFPILQIKKKTFYIPITNANKKCFVVDFYFELNKQKYIIEYNGPQHYKSFCFAFKSEERAQKNFERQQIRDEFVRNFCKENDIQLIEIDGRIYKRENNIRYYLREQLKNVIEEYNSGFFIKGME